MLLSGPMRESFLMTVTGTLAAPVDASRVHCGPPLPGRDEAGGTGITRTFQWEVKLNAHRLDDDGFVMDNAKVRAYFESITLISVSCEQLCRKACRKLWRENLRSLSVRIWGADWANVECTREEGNR